MSRSFREDLRSGVRSGLRQLFVWPPLSTAIGMMLMQAAVLLLAVTFLLPTLLSPPVGRAAIRLIDRALAAGVFVLAAAVLIVVAWGLGRHKRWAWIVGLTIEIPAALACGGFFWLGTEATPYAMRRYGLQPQPMPIRVIIVVMLALIVFGPVLYGLLHPATRVAAGGSRVRAGKGAH